MTNASSTEKAAPISRRDRDDIRADRPSFEVAEAGNTATNQLITFVAGLSEDNIPNHVVVRAEELFLDWVGSALAGWTMPPIPLFDAFAKKMGPADGPSEILGNKGTTSPWFAAFVNGASSHVAEQDDLHNASVLHPGAVVFPAVLAAAQDRGVSGMEMLVAAIAGYEAGVRIGEYLGRSHYRTFHTTGTVGTLAAAVAVGKLLKLDATTMMEALGSAGTQASGLWEFLRDAADSKQLHAGKAAADGLLSAYMALDGLTGARNIIEGEQGLAAGMSTDADARRINDRLGTRWATAETSIKYHASCRHTHPAADALLALLEREDIDHHEVVQIKARVHQAAIDVLGRVIVPATVHQAKFSMGTMLGLIAVHGRAGLDEFEQLALTDPDVERIRSITSMERDAEVDRAYPVRWLGRVEVRMRDGRILQSAIDHPRGDPENMLTRAELEAKCKKIGIRAPDWSPEELDALIVRIRSLGTADMAGTLL